MTSRKQRNGVILVGLLLIGIAFAVDTGVIGPLPALLAGGEVALGFFEVPGAQYLHPGEWAQFGALGSKIEGPAGALVTAIGFSMALFAGWVRRS